MCTCMYVYLEAHVYGRQSQSVRPSNANVKPKKRFVPRVERTCVEHSRDDDTNVSLRLIHSQGVAEVAGSREDYVGKDFVDVHEIEKMHRICVRVPVVMKSRACAEEVNVVNAWSGAWAFQ